MAQPSQLGYSFEPRSDDIYIATYPRSGTTLMQMMIYQLTSPGELTFQHAEDVMPFFEKAVRGKLDLSVLPSPRVFKTHLPYRIVSRQPGRYVYVSRSGKDVLISYFHFYRTYIDPRQTLPSFCDAFLAGKVQYGSWFRHVLDWAEHQNDCNTLFLRYEDLIRDLTGGVHRVTRFLDLQMSEEQHTRVLDRCQIGFMRQYEEKFKPVEETPRAPGSFIRQGISGSHKDELSAEQQEQFDRVASSFFAERGVTF